MNKKYFIIKNRNVLKLISRVNYYIAHGHELVKIISVVRWFFFRTYYAKLRRKSSDKLIINIGPVSDQF